MKRYWPVLLLIILFAIVLRCPTFIPNFVNIDENEYAIAAQKILAGGLPYKDVLIYQPPIIYYLYALGFWLTGGVHIWSAQIITIAFVVGTILALYFLGTAVAGSKKAGLAAGLAYGVFSTTFLPMDMLAANCEILMMLPLTLSVLTLFYAEKRSSYLLYLAAGIFASLGFLTKYQGGVVVAAEGLYILIITTLISRSFSLRKNLIPSIMLTIGFFIPITIIGLYLRANGAISYALEALHYIFLYAKGPVQNDPLYLIMKFSAKTGLFILPGIVMWYGAAAVIANRLSFLRRRLLPKWLACHSEGGTTEESPIKSVKREILRGVYPEQGRRAQDDIRVQQQPRRQESSANPAAFTCFCILWFFVSIIPVIVGGRIYFHYYFTLLPPAAVLFGVWWNEHGQFTKKWVKSLIVAWLIICVTGWTAYATYRPLKEPGRKDQWMHIAEYLKSNASPDETLYVWGYCPQIYIYSGLSAYTRFTTSDYLTGRSPMTAGLEYDPNGDHLPSSFEKFKNDFIDPPGVVIFDTSYNIFPKAWAYLREDFEKGLPTYIVDTAPSNYRRYGRYPMDNYPYLADIVRKNYKFVKSFEGFHLYKKKKKGSSLYSLLLKKGSEKGSSLYSLLL